MASTDSSLPTKDKADAGLSAVQQAPVSISQSNNVTKPSRPLAEATPRQVLGDSGTRMLHGIITEEYNPQLNGIQGIRIFDEMRKSDGTVRAAMSACTLPIRRAEYFIKPANDDDDSKEIANFVEHAIFDWLEGMTFDDLLRQALLMLPFGVMLFEKIYTTKEHDGNTFVTLKTLAPRLPRSILRWELADQTFGIEQIRQDGVLAQIPGSKLLIFVNEREGDNWWGTSFLRAPYKHWYMKNTIYKIDAIAIERQGLGVPMMEMPIGYTEDDEKKTKTALQNLRANENAYLIVPNGYKASFMDMGGHTTRDPNPSIEHHNKQILQSVLAQFLELGVSKQGSGSRALSQDHSDLFLSSMEAVAMTFISEINRNLIPELVDLNFPTPKEYPIMDYSGIKKVDVLSLGTAYSQLVTAGGLTPTDSDEQWIRAAIGLPPRTPEEIEAAAEDDQSSQDLLEEGIVEPADDGAPGDVTDPQNPDDNAAVDDATKKAPAPPQSTSRANKRNNKRVSVPVKKKAPDTKQPVAPKKKAASEPKIFEAAGGFKSWRPLMASEENVSWQKIQDTMDAMEANFTAAAQSILGDAKDEFMAALHDAIASGDTATISNLNISFTAKYEALLNDAMKKAYEYGKNNVSTEIGVPTPANDVDTLAEIALRARAIAEKAAADIESEAKISVANSMNADISPLQNAGNVDAALDDSIDKSIDDTSGIIVSQGINNGRDDVFQLNSADIHGLQRSEVLDGATCDFCLSMDGLVVDTDDSWARTDTFHNNCRGIWVAIMKDEQNPPDITGVPDKIGNYYGGQPNQLIQPPKPIIRPDSPAADEVKRRQDAKNK